MKTIEDLTAEVAEVEPQVRGAEQQVAKLEAERDAHREEALRCDLELVFAYARLDHGRKRLCELQSELMAAQGEPS